MLVMVWRWRRRSRASEADLAGIGPNAFRKIPARRVIPPCACGTKSSRRIRVPVIALSSLFPQHSYYILSMSTDRKYASIFNLLAEVFRATGVKAILVGGYAVNAYHYSRFTHDVDFMIAAEDLACIAARLVEAGFTESLRNDLVARYVDTADELAVVDFLLADHGTLDRMMTESGSTSIAGEVFALPSIQHLVAMKLHAIRSSHGGREFTDLPDIIILLRKNGIDPREESFRLLCLKYGDLELYNKILKGCA